MIFAYACQRHHWSYRPEDPRFGDTMACHSKWFVDDGVVPEPKLGHRVTESCNCLDAAMCHVWGEEGINQAKRKKNEKRRKSRSFGD